MAEAKNVTIDVEKIAALLPGYRVLSSDDLWQFYRVLSDLWEHDSKGLPEDFRLKLFVAEQFFYSYLLNGHGDYPTVTQGLAHVRTHIPYHPVS